MLTTEIQALMETIDGDINSKTAIYYNSDGHPVPRVTEILSRMIHNDALMYWSNSLGFKGLSYKKELTKAANIGTAAHTAIENYLKKKIATEDNIPFEGFLMWYTNITEVLNLPVKIIYIEHKMSCKWFGGTLDALIEIDGKIYLVDFKTSNHITFNYFLQLGAYRYMLKVSENIDIDGVICLQLNKLEPSFNEYILNFSIPEHEDFMNRCTNTFLSLVYSFYSISDIERRYKQLF